jgi:hypothetical protein
MHKHPPQNCQCLISRQAHSSTAGRRLFSAQNGTRLSSFMHLPTNQFEQKRSSPPYLHAGYHDMLLICTC